MHELGHAIGILKQNEKGEQEYDENLWSVMAKLSHKNCNAKPIRYSPEYWKQRNMEYYKVELSEYVGGKYGARIIITGEDPRGFQIGDIIYTKDGMEHTGYYNSYLVNALE